MFVLTKLGERCATVELENREEALVPPLDHADSSPKQATISRTSGNLDHLPQTKALQSMRIRDWKELISMEINLPYQGLFRGMSTQSLPSLIPSAYVPSRVPMGEMALPNHYETVSQLFLRPKQPTYQKRIVEGNHSSVTLGYMDLPALKSEAQSAFQPPANALPPGLCRKAPSNPMQVVAPYQP
ncbi:unnamed protein product [Arctogadus glacialis]